MYIFNVFKLLFTPSPDFGSPSNVLLPALAVACFALQLALMLRKRRGARVLPCIAAAVMLLMELLLHTVQSFTALIFIIIMVYAAAALLGIGAAAVVCAVVKLYKRKKNKEESGT